MLISVEVEAFIGVEEDSVALLAVDCVVDMSSVEVVDSAVVDSVVVGTSCSIQDCGIMLRT